MLRSRNFSARSEMVTSRSLHSFSGISVPGRLNRVSKWGPIPKQQTRYKEES